MSASEQLSIINKNLKELDDITAKVLKDTTNKNLSLRRGLRDTVNNYRMITKVNSAS